MSIQICCRDQRKMGHVIDQIKILANNLDELRAEINTLRTNVKDKMDCSHGSDFQRNKSSKTDVVNKVKKYIKKVTSMYSLKKAQKSNKIREPYYCTNLDPQLPSFLNYVLRTEKKEGVRQEPTKIKYLKNQGNQTTEKSECHQFAVRSPTASINVQNVEDIRYRASIANDGNGQRDEIMYPSKNANLAPKCSDISCELYVQVENPVSKMNIFSDSFTSNNYPENVEVTLLNGNNKPSSTKSTQTEVSKLGRKHRNLNFQYKHPNFCFSRIKNAVITRKIVRNTNESTYTVCGDLGNMRSYTYLREERCKRCNCKRRRDNSMESNYQDANVENLALEKTVLQLKNNPGTHNDVLPHFVSDEEPNLTPSSVSLNLEVNTSNNSNKIKEFSDRRKPRTYVVHKTTQKRNQDNWLNRFERSVIYVGPISDLSLSSNSFSNHNNCFN
ncbi:uncharacterized protein LOC108629120 [Ceratina calcarata]|uniref:Uncharacterized protein LOC108629120 n=1 Tax=Ceratina calcarata TaxID=156304 RepID=A0AAJ7J7W3_9HYME|nr:uncharacterized protein LOC108629120 [Ceratina calcarata]